MFLRGPFRPATFDPKGGTNATSSELWFRIAKAHAKARGWHAYRCNVCQTWSFGPPRGLGKEVPFPCDALNCSGGVVCIQW